MDEKYAKHVEEILSAVGKDVDPKEVEKELRNYVEEFRLSVSEAKKLIARKHGAAFAYSSEPSSKTIKDLTPADNNVNVLCRVVFVSEKTITSDGEEKVILSGIMGDDTGTIPFTIWEKGELELQKGEVLKIENAYVNEWRDEPQLNVGNRGIVTKTDDSALPPFNGEFRRRSSAPDYKIADIGNATGNVSVAGRIITLETREVNVSGETKDVMSGILADETGKISYTCWGKAKMKRGDVVKVGSGYLRRWRGMPQLNFDASTVEKTKEDMPSEEELVVPSGVTILDLEGMGGMVDAAITGVILDVRQGSGLVFRCPECNRVLQKNQCRVHGEVEGEADLRTKAVVDDGTGAMTVIIGRDLSERLLGKSLDKCLKEAKKAMDHSVIKDQLFEQLVARPVTVMGNVTSDDFGLMQIANNVEFVSTEPQEEARKMLEELL